MTVTATARAHPGDRDWPGDERAVSRFLSGDVLGFEQIVHHYSGMVFSLAARLVGAADAEDVVQETFLRAWHGLETLPGRVEPQDVALRDRPEPRPRPDGTLSRLRAMFTQGKRAKTTSSPRLDDAADPSLSPEENAVVKERRRRLRAAMRTLPDDSARPSSCAISRACRTKKSPSCSRFRSEPCGAASRAGGPCSRRNCRERPPDVPRLAPEDLDLLSRAPSTATSRRRRSSSSSVSSPPTPPPRAARPSSPRSSRRCRLFPSSPRRSRSRRA